ncbi:MAG: hypothetical protein ACJAYF_003953 [Arenicella sp.]|jgi:hypothetical protein
MKSLIVIILGLWGSWYYIEIGSVNLLQNVFAPLGVFIFLCALLIWLLTKFGGFGTSSHSSGSIFGGNSEDSGGADGVARF